MNIIYFPSNKINNCNYGRANSQVGGQTQQRYKVSQLVFNTLKASFSTTYYSIIIMKNVKLLKSGNWGRGL